MSENGQTANRISPLLRLALDLGPLVLFFAVYEWRGIYTATAVFIAAILAVLAAGYAIEKRLAPMPLFTAVLVVVFGGLTLYLKNDIFIKMKPTVLYALFGFVLLGGLTINHLFIKYIFGHAFDLTDAGWRKLTWRWAIFFLLLAGLNEFVWRDYPTDIWVKFKVFGILPLIMLFALAQTPFLMKHQIEEKPN